MHRARTASHGVLWIARSDKQARKLSKTKSSSVVPEAPFGLEKDVQRRVDVLSRVLDGDRWPAKGAVSFDTVLTHRAPPPRPVWPLLLSTKKIQAVRLRVAPQTGRITDPTPDFTAALILAVGDPGIGT